MAASDELLTARFNQDASCVAVGTRRGYQLFTCAPFASQHSSADGGVAVIEMLFSSSLVALVSAGERPGDSPRRLRLWNTRSNTSICDLNFSTAVLAVRMNKARLIAALETKLHFFELSTMKLLHTLETAPNPRGLVELSAEADSCHCALPAGQPEGQALLFDAANLCALNTVQAHRSKLAAMALSPRGELLATASEKGTVIRVHTFPQGGLAHTFRRGSMPATISSLAFSPGVLVGGMREASAVLLAAASTTGTVHVWRLDAQRGGGDGGAPPDVARSASGAVSAAVGGAASRLPLVSGERDFASVKLAAPAGATCHAALHDGRTNEAVSGDMTLRHSLYVWTDAGAWYAYSLDPLRGGECALVDEQRLVSAAR